MFDEMNRRLSASSRRSQADRDHQPDGPRLHRRRLGVRWQKWSAAGRVHPGKALSCTRFSYAERPEPAGRLRAALVGDGRPVRRLRADPLEQERLRHGRGRDGPDGQTRSPRCDAWARFTISTAWSTTPWATPWSFRTGVYARGDHWIAWNTLISAPARWRTPIPPAGDLHDRDRRHYEYGFFWYLHTDARSSTRSSSPGC